VRTKVFLFVLFLVGVIVDQATKLAVDNMFSLYDSHSLLGNVLRLHYIRNSGAAFGLRYGNAGIMLAVTVAVTVILLYLFLSGKLDPGTVVGNASVVLVIAGAVGNLIDRIRMGEVIDFIDMGIGSYRWPTYNFADIFVTVGMIILLIHFLFFPPRTEEMVGDDS